jgi:hypothetical protein
MRASSAIVELLIVLQVIQVAILWMHDWVPMGPLNDVIAVKSADTRGRLIRVTLIQCVPYTIGLIATALNMNGFPAWLWWWLWISYSLLLLGEIRAWWWPYFVRAEPQRAERYKAMFGQTHSFLPERNGIRPNTLHCVLHLSTLLTLALLVYCLSQ